MRGGGHGASRRWLAVWSAPWLLACPSAAMLPTTPSMDPMADARPEGCVLERWEDGDTAEVDCGSDVRERVRLQAIEAPALGDDLASRTRAQWQAQLWQLPYKTVLRCGAAALARVREICPPGSQVELYGDDSDRDDHRLAFVRCGGQTVNQRLLDEGHAGSEAAGASGPSGPEPERPRLCR